MEMFNLRKWSDVEIKEQCEVEILNGFGVLENLRERKKERR
jgi:hypothetical protein